MAFSNPVTTAVDPVARSAADQAANDAARALTQIIPGSRLAADAIDGKTITGVTVSGATVLGSLIRATGSGDASPTSSGHALQVGPTGSYNLAIDDNEIVPRNNGRPTWMYLQYPRSGQQENAPDALARKDYVDSGGTRGARISSTVSVATGITAVNSFTHAAGVGMAVVFFRFFFTATGTPPTVAANGTVPATKVGQLAAGWEALDTVPLVTGSAGPQAAGYLLSDGGLYLTAVAPGTVLTGGTNLSLTAVYPLAGSYTVVPTPA